MPNDPVLPARSYLLRVPQPLKIESLARDGCLKPELGGGISDSNPNIKLLTDTSHLSTLKHSFTTLISQCPRAVLGVAVQVLQGTDVLTEV